MKVKHVLKSIASIWIKDRLSKDNLKSKTSVASYTTSGALAYLVANPPGSEHDVIMQALLAITSVILFFYKKETNDK